MRKKLKFGFWIYLCGVFLINSLGIGFYFAGAQTVEENLDYADRLFLLDEEAAFFKILINSLNKDVDPRLAYLNNKKIEFKKERIREQKAHYQVGYQHAQEGDYVLAIKEFEMALKYGPLDKDTHYNLGYLYAKVDRFEEAVKEYEKALALPYDKKDGQICYNLALIYGRHLRNKVKAQEYYKKFLKIHKIAELEKQNF